MITLRSILVPLDGSRLAEQAVPVAQAIAERARCRLKLVLVHQPDILVEPGPDYSRLQLAKLKADREYLRTVARGLRGHLGDAVSATVLQGPITQTLATYTRARGTDLVVMTTHGRGGPRRAWLGSVADRLVRTAEVPILLVRAREEGAVSSSPDFSQILVPLDGSPLSEAAVIPAATLARLWDGEVLLVQIVPSVLSAADDRTLGAAVVYNQRLTAIRRSSAEDYVGHLAERLRAEGVKATGLAVLGSDVADRLLGLARPERVGLVVIASHGRGGLQRLVLGSVTDKLVRAAEVPVLVFLRRTRNQSKRPARAAGVRVAATALS